MGKRYYCDYCDRSFLDGAENRKKHLGSTHHIKLRNEHYDYFKSASTRLEEFKLKKPCRKFHLSGVCDFGPTCKFSHLTPKDIVELEQQERLEKYGGIKPKADPDIDEWVEMKLSKMKKSSSADHNSLQPALPKVLSNIPNLPPSLIPCASSEIISQEKDMDPQWG